MSSDDHKKIFTIITDSGSFYTFKELEQLSKLQGIAENQLKNILIDLLSDESIEGDKIGSTFFYWINQEKKHEKDKKKSDELKLQNKELSEKILELEKAVKDSEKTVNKEEIQKCEQLSNDLEILKAEEKNLEEFLALYKTAQVINGLKAGIEELTTAINRWTDNIFNMKSWFKRKFPALLDENLDKEFRIPSDLDYF